MSQYNKAIAGAAAPQITILVLWLMSLIGLMETPPDINEVAAVLAWLIMTVISAATVYFAPKNTPAPPTPPSDQTGTPT